MWPFNKNKRKEEEQKAAIHAERVSQEWEKVRYQLEHNQASIRNLTHDIERLQHETRMLRSLLEDYKVPYNRNVISFFERFIPEDGSGPKKRRKTASWQPSAKASDNMPQMDKLFQ